MKALRTCVSHLLTFQKKNTGYLSYKISFAKAIHADTRFSTDTDEFLIPERRPGCRVVDDQLHTRAGYRLHETVH